MVHQIGIAILLALTLISQTQAQELMLGNQSLRGISQIEMPELPFKVAGRAYYATDLIAFSTYLDELDADWASKHPYYPSERGLQTHSDLFLYNPLTDSLIFLNQEINTLDDEINPVFSSDRKLMVFTRIKKDISSEHRTLHHAIYTNGEWSYLGPIPFDSKDPVFADYANIDSEGKTIYFASSILPGHGGMDLFVSHKKGLLWTAPENLGESINSRKNEICPYLSSDSVLFFSSDKSGRNLHIYSCNLRDKDWMPKMMPTPLNSEKNEFSFQFLSAQNDIALVVSNRNKNISGQYFFKVDYKVKLVAMQMLDIRLQTQPEECYLAKMQEFAQMRFDFPDLEDPFFEPKAVSPLITTMQIEIMDKVEGEYVADPLQTSLELEFQNYHKNNIAVEVID